MQTAGWKKLGWQGLELSVPDTWDLSAHSGNYRKGYLRLDDGERIRLEVRWEHQKRQVDIGDVVERSLKNAAKEISRKGIEFRSKRHLKTSGGEKREECFRWTGDIQAINLVRQCESCGRVVFVRVLGEVGAREGLLPTAKRVFRELTDHPEADWVLWRALGLNARVRKEYQLSRNRLLAGRIYLCFRGAPGTLEIERTALADRELRGRSMEEWTAARLKHPERYTIVVQDTVQGHQLWAAQRTKRSRWSARHGPQTLVTWHCEVTNRLFAVVLSRGEVADLSRRARICCHESAQV